MNIHKSSFFKTSVGRASSVGFGIGAVLTSCVLAMPMVAMSAGFDCKYAKSHVEKLICADSGLSRLDEQMNMLFDKIQSETAGHDGETGKVIDPVGKEQTVWRTTVRDQCKDAACLKSAYRTRLSDMRKNWAQALEPADQ